MLNTDKLLYILPDVAYLAELLPGKQEYNYQVSNFHQVNGKFLDDNQFLSENVVKLLAKFEKDTYSLILPDFLFTNTILNVKESSETAVKEYLKEKVLPQLGISHKTHQIQFYVLTQHRGVFKVQLSAIENSVLAPIKAAANQYGLTLEKIYPLSWTTKSLISLEPSISVVQMGSKLYLALHYIGIDQTNDAEADNAEKLVETIKTLKGAEPSIQTVYLTTSQLVENKFKTGLKDMLPVQQLADNSSGEMPSYVKMLIEAGMKTLAIPDFQLPEFNFVKVAADQDALSMAKDAAKEKETMPEDTQESLSISTPKEEEETETKNFDDSALPKPSIIGGEPETESLSEEDGVSVKTIDLEEDGAEDKDLGESVPSAIAATPTVAGSTLAASAAKGFSSFDEDEADKDVVNEEAPQTKDVLKEEEEIKPESPKESASDLAEKPTFGIESPREEETLTLKDEDEEVDLSQFVQDESENSKVADDNTSKVEDQPTAVTDTEKPAMMSENNKQVVKGTTMNETALSTANKAESKDKKDKKVIKNKDGIGGMLKTVFVFLASVAVTVAIGIGLGLGFIKFTNKTETEVAQEVEQTEQSAEPTPTTAPTPEPTPEVDKEEYAVLVVNATTISGHAGETKTALTDEGFTEVSAANAKGDYEEGYYVLLEEEDEAMVEFLSEVSGLELDYQDGKKTEDPSGKYDAVIVLAK